MKKKDFFDLSTISLENYDDFFDREGFWEPFIRQILDNHKLPDLLLKAYKNGSNIVYRYGERLIIKLFPHFLHHQFIAEKTVLENIQEQLSVPVPAIHYRGKVQNWDYLIITFLEGETMGTIWPKLNDDQKERILWRLGQLAAEVHQIPVDPLRAIDIGWKEFVQRQQQGCQARHQRLKLPQKFVQDIPGYLHPDALATSNFKPVLLTGEYTPENVLLRQNQTGDWEIAALIDFADSMLGFRDYDLLGPCVFSCEGKKGLLEAFLQGYGYSKEQLSEELAHRFFSILLLHRYSNLEFQIRISGWKEAHNLQELQKIVFP